MIALSRRKVLIGLLAAPIVCRPGLLMPVKMIDTSPIILRFYDCLTVGVDYGSKDSLTATTIAVWRDGVLRVLEQKIWPMVSPEEAINKTIEMASDHFGGGDEPRMWSWPPRV